MFAAKAQRHSADGQTVITIMQRTTGFWRMKDVAVPCGTAHTLAHATNRGLPIFTWAETAKRCRRHAEHSPARAQHVQ